MRHLRERSLLSLILLGGPMLVYFGVVRPSQARMKLLSARRDAAEQTAAGALSFAPLSRDERAFLEASAPQIAARLPWIDGDQARLTHYYRVVSDLHQVWKAAGIQPAGIRSSWDPIRASFSLPATLGGALLQGTPVPAGTKASLNHWVIEARLDPPTRDLFVALEALPKMTPILEPLGFRWSDDPERGRQQSLILRNHYLTR